MGCRVWRIDWIYFNISSIGLRMEILVVLELEGLKDKVTFEKHLTKEGFEVVPDEKYVYSGTTDGTTFSTKAFILEVFKQGLLKSGFDKCSMIFQLGDTPWQAFIFDFKTNEFEMAKQVNE